MKAYLVVYSDGTMDMDVVLTSFMLHHSDLVVVYDEESDCLFARKNRHGEMDKPLSFEQVMKMANEAISAAKKRQKTV